MEQIDNEYVRRIKQDCAGEHQQVRDTAAEDDGFTA